MAVICRIGSLETARSIMRPCASRYLPHRQFRNFIGEIPKKITSYLPHRQFRNTPLFVCY